MQQTISHQMMGYDRASTMFSPDGRLLQVEYARKSVKSGTSVIALVCTDGIVMIADRRILDKLIVPNSIEKISQIDGHVAAAASGIVSDGRLLIEKAQLLAQQHKVTYDSDVDVNTIVKELCNIKQSYTQYGGARPFGISLLIAGVDSTGPRLYMTDPAGIYWEYKATAIGEGEDELKEILSKQYKENITMQDGLKLGISALKTVLGKEFSLDRIEAVTIEKGKEFKNLGKDQLKRLK